MPEAAPKPPALNEHCNSHNHRQSRHARQSREETTLLPKPNTKTEPGGAPPNPKNPRKVTTLLPPGNHPAPNHKNPRKVTGRRRRIPQESGWRRSDFQGPRPPEAHPANTGRNPARNPAGRPLTHHRAPAGRGGAIFSYKPTVLGGARTRRRLPPPQKKTTYLRNCGMRPSAPSFGRAFKGSKLTTSGCLTATSSGAAPPSRFPP